MKNQFLTKLAIATLATATVFSCAKDRDADDYKSEQANKYLAQDKAAEGRYSGMLTDEAGNMIGAFEVTLKTTLNPNPNSDATTGTAAPQLMGSFVFQNDQDNITFVTSQPNYDPRTGNYSATISIPLSGAVSAPATTSANSAATTSASASSVQLNFGCTINGDTISNGTMQATNVSSNIVHFKLTRNGDSVSSLASKATYHKPTIDLKGSPVSSFRGTTTFTDGESLPVQILIQNPPAGTPEDFLNYILQDQLVTVAMNFGANTPLTHSDAHLNLFTNKITGAAMRTPNSTQTTSTGPTSAQGGAQVSTPISLDCDLSSDLKSIQCKQYATTASGTGIVAMTKATYEATVSKLPKAPTNNSRTVVKTYKAYRSQQVTDAKTHQTKIERTSVSTLKGQSSELTLSVSFPGKTFDQQLTDLYFSPTEQLVSVTLLLDADIPSIALPIGMNSVVWDTVNGTLDGGSGTNSAGNSASQTLTIDCTNFTATPTNDTTDKFECVYGSTDLGTSITFTGYGGTPSTNVVATNPKSKK